MELDGLQNALVRYLTENGIPAQVSWPAPRRTGPEEVTVLVSLDQVNCSGAGLQDYLGLRLDEKSGMWEEVYGRKAELTFVLDIYATPQAGARRCREVFSQIAGAVQPRRVLGLCVKSLTGEETEFDSKEGLLKLRVRLVCQGWVYAGQDGQENAFLDFILKGDVKA